VSNAPRTGSENKGSVNSPPETRRTCNSSKRESCGGEAIEKAAAPTSGKQNVDILAGLEFEAFRRGQAQV
jgi:hypothetical protein